MIYDASIILLIPAIIFTMIAQGMVKANFAKYTKVRNIKGLTGEQAARRVLDANGLSEIPILRCSGKLTDHYDPRERTLSLSENVYDVKSIAAISVACHEVGHAIQHDIGYAPLTFRNGIVPVVNIMSTLSWPMAIIGIILLGYNGELGNTVFLIGIIGFLAVVVFHLVTLPVELDASSRAINQMDELGLITSEDRKGAKKVLKAAAMTYLAALFVAVANLIRILVIKNSRD